MKEKGGCSPTLCSPTFYVTMTSLDIGIQVYTDVPLHGRNKTWWRGSPGSFLVSGRGLICQLTVTWRCTRTVSSTLLSSHYLMNWQPWFLVAGNWPARRCVYRDHDDVLPTVVHFHCCRCWCCCHGDPPRSRSRAGNWRRTRRPAWG